MSCSSEKSQICHRLCARSHLWNTPEMAAWTTESDAVALESWILSCDTVHVSRLLCQTSWNLVKPALVLVHDMSPLRFSHTKLRETFANLRCIGRKIGHLQEVRDDSLCPAWAEGVQGQRVINRAGTMEANPVQPCNFKLAYQPRCLRRSR